MGTYITRAAWGARPPKRVYPHPGLPVAEIWVHHTASATPTALADIDGDGAPDAEEAIVKMAQNYHMDSRGWSDIAYNFLVGQSGVQYEGRGWDRKGGGTGDPEDSRSYSICAIGNYETATPTNQLLGGIADLIAGGIRAGNIQAGWTIHGDRDTNATACPGANLYARLADIKELVDRRLAVPDVPPYDPVDAVTDLSVALRAVKRKLGALVADGVKGWRLRRAERLAGRARTHLRKWLERR